jgi:TPR repeat protein
MIASITRFTIPVLACLALVASALAQESNAPASLDERMAPAFQQPEGMTPEPLSAVTGPPSLEENDASLNPAVDPKGLRTTLEPIDIEQRIDKGLTAAGERSTFKPDYAFAAFQRGWFLTSFSLALDRAKSGDAAAQTLLGVLLSRGLGIKQDIPAAIDWYGLAGKAGDREALYSLGQLYLDGEGVAADPAKAAGYFKQAADLGNAAAARELGYLLMQGKGQAENAMLAAAYFRRAAGSGDMDAQYTLAGLYVQGVGVVPDSKLAARWFAEAARNGHVGAQVEYGLLLFNGKGVPKDETAAASWFTRAANADNPAAQIRLARILADGRGVTADPAAAARWYMIAKDHGLNDDYMDSWMRGLDEKTRDEARKAADAWSRGGPQLQAAVLTPDSAAPVDKQVE